jgi:hypothetical protein
MIQEAEKTGKCTTGGKHNSNNSCMKERRKIKSFVSKYVRCESLDLQCQCDEPVTGTSSGKIIWNTKCQGKLETDNTFLSVW